MKQLVYLAPNSLKSIPFTTSDVISEYAELQHHTITKLIQKHTNDLEEFGILRFKVEEIRGRGQPEKHYELNEEQATLLITYLKNTPPVREFKKNLVKAFFAMKAELSQRRDYRIDMKPLRRDLTDSIKENPDKGKWSYKLYTDLVYMTATGMNAAQLRKKRGADKTANARNFLTSSEMKATTKVETVIAGLHEIGMGYDEIKLFLLGQKERTLCVPSVQSRHIESSNIANYQ